MGLLDRAGARLTARPEDADILVVNTCSFIDTAKQESVDTILEMARHKTEGRATKLIVAGCLVERYRDEIRKNIPEVDAVVGTGELESILEAAGVAPAASATLSPFHILSSNGHAEVRSGRESGAGTHKADDLHSSEDAPIAFRAEGDHRERQGRFRRDDWQGAAHLLPTYLYDETTPRLLSTGRTSAYIKIAEGCDHPCSFCIIPNLRGKFRSRRFESVVAEAQRLVASGVQEITLIGQDTTCYGEDLGMKDGLATLLDALARHRRPALAALPLRVSEPHHGPAAGDDRQARQHLQVSRCAAAARVARRAEAHEARRRRGDFSEDPGEGARGGSRHCVAHFVHRRLSRRVAPRL